MEKFSPEALKFSESALAHFASSIQGRGKGLGVRIGVKKAGCSGFEYFFEYVDDILIIFRGPSQMTVFLYFDNVLIIFRGPSGIHRNRHFDIFCFIIIFRTSR